jgi:hypothetical protein
MGLLVVNYQAEKNEAADTWKKGRMKIRGRAKQKIGTHSIYTNIYIGLTGYCTQRFCPEDK